MSELHVTRAVRLPDELRVARCRRAPELGPSILFFSGGTALRAVSRSLKQYTHNSIHLITPFDSGGSSAKLRETFGMLSVGDLRNRLMALADDSVRGNPEIYRLFAHRFPEDADPGALGAEFKTMVEGDHELVTAVPNPMRQIIRTHLRQFAERMPWSFDLRGASMGNLVLAGGYLNNDNDIESVVFLFSKLVEARGIVRPVVDVDMHLVGELADGTRVVGQHLLTGKIAPPITAPVADLYLVPHEEDCEPTRPHIHGRTQQLIADADLVCFPMGSFYSSVVANLLPAGVGRGIRDVKCPKVYVPNTGDDPEQVGMSIGASVEALVRFVRRDAGEETPVADIVNFVLVDRKRGSYREPLEVERITELGIEVVDTTLVTDSASPDLDPDLLSRILVSLA